MRFWFVHAEQPRVRFIKAEPPCMKGELQVGRWVLGWSGYSEDEIERRWKERP